MVKKITAEQLDKMLDSQDMDFCLLDVRSKDKFEQFHIESDKEAVNIFKQHILEDTEEQNKYLSQLPKDKEIIVTCTTGNSAGRCANVLSEKGYDVKILDGGLTSWKEYKQSNE